MSAAPGTLAPPLTVPAIEPDTDTLSAALAYAASGIYIGPTLAGSKRPHPELGKRWQDRTSCDPEVLTSWFAGTAHGVFIHAGASGLVILDVDHPERLHPAIDRAVRECEPPFQSTRADEPGRGHYIFAVPEGRTFGSGTGQLGSGWGEVRGGNSLIVAAPSVHALAAEGGRYAWQRTGAVPTLPGYLTELLPDPHDAAQTTTALGGPGPVYDALSAQQQGEARRYVAAAVSGWRQELGQAASWAERIRDDNGRGWEKLLADACLRFGSLARADWTPWTLADGWQQLQAIVPAPMAGAVG